MNDGTQPTRIGPYAVERRLGSGGMGEVYLAYSVAGDPIAVKVIRPDRTDPHNRARFEREATIARTLSGTGRVARFIDADPFAEQPWLATDFIAGQPLSDVVKDGGPLPVPLVASLGALLAEGLAAVHSTGLVHRDLKAANVVLGNFGPVIIDFGLGAFLDASKGSLSQPGAVVIGTIRCMPPEQAMGETDVTPAADVYGLGTVLLHAATGHEPYDGVRWAQVAAQVVNPAVGPDLSGLPDELADVVSPLLAHEPDERPSLEKVTRQCADLLHSLGTSPARARRDLIQHTTPNDRSVRTPPQPDGPMLDRLDALDRELREQPEAEQPDTPAVEPVDRAGAEAGAKPPAQRKAPSPSPSSPARPGRPPASHRVAKELRERYSRRPSLSWSKR